MVTKQQYRVVWPFLANVAGEVRGQDGYGVYGRNVYQGDILSSGVPRADLDRWLAEGAIEPVGESPAASAATFGGLTAAMSEAAAPAR